MAVTLTTPNTLLGTFQPKSETSKLLTNIVLVVLGTLLLTASAKFKVPLPPVPFTLQTLAVALIAGAAGWRIGVATVALYLVEGLAGLPVFANGGGIGYVMSPTFGFLVGYLPMAWLIGRFADRGASGRVVLLFVTMLVADAVVFVLGFGWLLAVSEMILNSGAALPKWLDATNLIGSAYDGAVKPFLIWDALKMLFAALTVTGGWTLLRVRKIDSGSVHSGTRSDPLLDWAAGVMIVSVVVLVGRYAYSSGHPEEALAAALGVRSMAFEVAPWSLLLGWIGFFVGLGLLIGGLARSRRDS